jgi:hypothetical protein
MKKRQPFTPRRTSSAFPVLKPAPSPHRALPPLHDPADAREDERNAALDAVETLITNPIASGAEAPLRARLARLLPTESAGGSP